MFPRLSFLAASLLVIAALPALAGKKTVCTITVNSPDEREVLKQSLPPDRFDFVELVERGRPDWLAAACNKKVTCDVLVVSGHFAGTEFYSSRFTTQETLKVDEIERATCSDSCPDLFGQLKEVYLFGCDTLKPEPVRSAMPEIVRGLVRAGQPRAEAERVAHSLSERHAESSRDLMRRIFANVPLIYGFSSLAPLGRAAGPMLQRHFDSSSAESFGSGDADPRLLALFGPASMVVTQGQTDSEANADYRREACRFVDDRITAAQRLGFMHQLLAADMPELRMSFDRVEGFFAALPARAQQDDAFTTAAQALARDKPAADRYLGMARETEDPALRVRMISLARTIGWLSAADERVELALMVHDVIAGDSMGFGEVDLLCTLNRERGIDASMRPMRGLPMERVVQSAGMACLGSRDARGRVLRALASPDEADVQAAQAYLRHHPIDDPSELRQVVVEVARMKSTPSQVRALGALARQHIADRELIAELSRLFVRTGSIEVQRAVAEVFIRADARALSPAQLVPLLNRHRRRSPGGGADLIDTLLQRLQS